MLVLGIETSCDETGVALYDDAAGLIGQVLHSQVTMHAAYGGVVPELASRDHIRRTLPLLRQLLSGAGRTLSDISAIAYTAGPGLAGALLVGASIAQGLAYALDVRVIAVHHMEGHLLSPLLGKSKPAFPFVALLVSGGHTQLLRVNALGDYELMGETLDDAAGEAFDKTAKLLGLGYPGGPALARLAAKGNPHRFGLPRPMLDSGDFNFSFSGLKTAVLTRVTQDLIDEQGRADLAAGVQEAITEVLVTKCLSAAQATGARQLVVAGGVGANRRLRELLSAAGSRHGIEVFYPPIEFCTDNGAMIALAGAMRLQDKSKIEDRGPCRTESAQVAGGFTVKPRWELEGVS